MIIFLAEQVNTPGWAKGIFTVILIAIFFGIKRLFSSKKEDDQ
ncbi:MAG: putative membrane protein YvbJ [Psychroserpens sp.]|jgi:hypothetical protein